MNARRLARTSLGVVALECATLAYFAIGKTDFESRLAWGTLSLNWVLEAVVLVTLCAVAWSRRRTPLDRSPVLGCIAAMTALLWIGTIDTANAAYAFAKPLGFAGIVLPVAALVVLRGTTERDAARLLALWCALGVAMAGVGLVMLACGVAPARLAVAGGGGNVFGRMVASAWIALLGIDPGRFRRAGKPAKLALGMALGGALLCSGSKSAILGFGIAATTLYAMTRRFRWSAGALVATAAIAIAPLWVHRVLPVRDEHRGVERVFRAADVRDRGSSYGARLDYYRRSIELLRTRGWLGVGTGGWGPAVHLPTGRRYPHNMIFELACELGLAGLAVLALALVVAGMQLRGLVSREGSPVLVATLVALAVFWLLNAQLSGDLLDNRHIWWPLLLLERLHRDRRNATPSGATGSIRADSFGTLAAT